MEKRRYRRGQAICEGNSECADMYLILSGQVRVCKTINWQ